MNPGLALLTFFPSRVGGTETYVRGLLQAFAEGAGPETATVLTSNLSDRFARELCRGNLSCVQLPSYRSGTTDLGRLLAMQRARLRNPKIANEIPANVDLMHYPVTVPIPRKPDLPSVVTLADVQHHDLKHMFSKAERAYRRWAYDRSARQADAVITISEFSKERIVSLLGVPERKVHVIQHGVDRSVFHPLADGSPAFDLSAYQLDESIRYFLYPAAGWRHKNHQRLLEAFRYVADPDVFLILTGGLAHQVPKSSDRRVIHAGGVSTQELAALYQGAVGVLLPSLYEGFGLPAIEAMACGTPLAVSDTPALSEICGAAAIRFDPYDPGSIGDAISALADDDALRTRLAKLGLERAAYFTWERAASEHMRVYEAVAG